jgi:N-acetylglucosaminyldiphosphoundecaprenol N-acetyl-beta-D-mannosaminyltransferase
MSASTVTAPFVPSAVGVASPQVPHAEFLGFAFCLLTPRQVVNAIIEHSGAPYRYVVTPNSYHIVAAYEKPEQLFPIYRDAWLSLCDSRIVRALARLDRRRLPLVTGSDLVAALLLALDGERRHPKRILVVGPPRDAQAALQAAYPNLQFDFQSAPSGLAQDAEARRAVARSCMRRRWDIALLCVGCPAQELIARQLAEFGCKSGVALCVGASIDFLTGARARAPLWVQRLSLEWAFRLVQEPSRLWRRYLVESPKILRIFMATRMQQNRRKRLRRDYSRSR